MKGETVVAQESPKRKKAAEQPGDEKIAAVEQAKAEAKAALTQAKAEEQARLKAEKALTEAQQAVAAAQEEAERERQERAKLEQTLSETQEAAAAAEAEGKKEREARVKAEKALAETREALTAAQAEAEDERQARTEAEKALAEVREALAAAQAEVEEERQARTTAENARAKAERALMEAKEAATAEKETTQVLPPALGEEGVERRVSFIVRLTVDERGQPRRTEVEHAQSGRKERFPNLNVQRLATFMRACISPAVISEPAPHPPTPPAGPGAPTLKPARAVSALTISDVRVYRPHTPQVPALTLGADEPFVVRARFELQSPEGASLAAQEPSFEVQVYTYDVMSGKSALLTTYRGTLEQDVVEYAARMEAWVPSPGLYRLVTLVTIEAPAKVVAYHEGPVVHITEPELSASPTRPEIVLLP